MAKVHLGFSRPCQVKPMAELAHDAKIVAKSNIIKITTDPIYN